MISLYYFYLALYVIIHVFFTMYWNLWGQSFCFLYVGAILFLPLDFGTVFALLLAFGSGLAVDMFYDTPGLHASALVLLAYARPRFINWLTPQTGYEANSLPHIDQFGMGWLLRFTYPLLLIHHIVLLAVEYGELAYLPMAIWKGLLSSFLTLTVILLIQVLFKNRFTTR